MRVQVPPPAPLFFGRCQTNFEGELNPSSSARRNSRRKEAQLFARSGLSAYLDWQTRFIKIFAFKTSKVAGISELI
jgi:hypothetical protein